MSSGAMSPGGSPELLAQLRDIHGAPPVPFWPPAPGWWILAALVLLALIWLGRRLALRWRANQRRQAVLQQLAELRNTVDPTVQPQAWLSAVNRLLKITAMQAFPEQALGTLQGDAWVSYLAGEGASDAFAPLAAGPYQPQPSFDDAALEGAASDWIRRHG